MEQRRCHIILELPAKVGELDKQVGGYGESVSCLSWRWPGTRWQTFPVIILDNTSILSGSSTQSLPGWLGCGLIAYIHKVTWTESMTLQSNSSLTIRPEGVQDRI